ncbi:MAG: hypothetical protein KGJ14_05740 [Nitrospirota bacterium]|nr:hypothetical protein [Nitrospirota bacterium]
MSLGLAPVWGQTQAPRPVKITLDFTDVDLPIFVRFISELTGKHFVLDEKVMGKITVFSPTKVTVDQAYSMFLSALEVRRLTAVPKGDVIQIVPTAELPLERSAFVYRLKHAGATDTATVLTNLVARSLNPPPTPGGRPLLRPATEFEAPVQVFADKSTNSLIMTATKGDYERLLSVIKALDTRRKQVFVEAIIMEVDVNRLRQLGSDPVEVIGALKKGALAGLAGFNIAPEQIQSIALALTGASTGGVNVANTVNVRAFLQLLMNMTDTNLISTPQLLASDNQKAKIVVGQNVPIPTGQAQGITGGTLVTIERKDVGVTLELTPQVLDNGLVRLEVKEEITSIVPGPQVIGTSTTTSVPVGPTFTKRSMETVTIAHDEQTIVIGGLVEDDIQVTENKIPFFGDIPGLGWLFKSQSTQITKQNLLVFLTPHVLKDEVDIVKLNERKGQEVEQAQTFSTISAPTAVKKATDALQSAEPPAPPQSQPEGK